MSSPSSKPSRGAVLTVFAVLFVVLAISNFSKPFHLDSRAGFVFFGVKTSGIANDILGPAFGVWLLVYAIGIWRMRRWALPVGYAYAAYVITNLVLFTIRTGVVPGGPSTRGAIIYLVIAIGVSAGAWFCCGAGKRSSPKMRCPQNSMQSFRANRFAAILRRGSGCSRCAPS